MDLNKDQIGVARKRFNDQKYSAKHRVDSLGVPIEWKLTFEEWLDIWDKSGQYFNLGRRKGQYCMSRHNDIGPYSANNVQIKLFSANVSEAQIGRIPNAYQIQRRKEVNSKPKSIAHKAALSESKSRPIMTPAGEFPSILKAAAYYNHHTKWIHNKLALRPTEFYRL